jgi:hypothetical protein
MRAPAAESADEYEHDSTAASGTNHIIAVSGTRGTRAALEPNDERLI